MASVVASELEYLKCAAQEQMVREERLQQHLEERHQEMSELQLAYDAEVR